VRPGPLPRGTRNVWRFGTLLVALLLLMVLLPFLPAGSVALPVVSILFSLLMVASVYAVSHNRRLGSVGLLLATPTLVLEWVTKRVDSLSLLVAEDLLSIAFLGLVLAVLFRRILRQQDVSTDTIYGGICVYLLLGVVCVKVYDLLELLMPGSFVFGEGPLPDGFAAVAQSERVRRFLFFSFVTLTTLGYGDITPVTDQARAIAILEAVIGPLFLAIFIARLVGLHTVQSREDPP
jgi:hypothetical protein